MSSPAPVAARGAFVSILGQLAKFAIQIVAIAVLSRMLDQHDFGFIAMVTAFTGFAALLSDFGLSMAAMRTTDISAEQKSYLFWLNAGIGLVLSIVVFLLAVPIASFYSEPELVTITRILSPIFLVNALGSQFRAELASRFRFRGLAVIDVLGPAVGLILGVACALAVPTWLPLVVQQFGAAVTTVVALVIASKWRPGSIRGIAAPRHLIRFGAQTTGVQVVNYITGNIDTAMIGRNWGATAAGLYDRAFQLFRMPLVQLIAPLTRVALPILSRLPTDVQFVRYARASVRAIAYSIGTMLAIVAATAPYFVDIVLGDGWEESARYLQILGIGGVFQAIGYAYYWMFLARDLTGAQLRYTLISRTLMVAAVVACSFVSATAVAVAVSAGLLLNLAILTAFVIPLTPVARRDVLVDIARPLAFLCACAGAAFALSRLGGGTSPWVHMLQGLAGFVAVAALAYVLVRPVRRDLLELGRFALSVRAPR